MAKASGPGKGPAQYWARMTPEERSIEMARRMKMRGRRRRKSHRKPKQITHAERNGKLHGRKEDYSNHISYLFGKAETLIEYYADTIGVPRATLARRVGELLQRKHDEERTTA